jgi:lipopolysaccharide biosynthesis regulator YciM
VRQRQGDLLNAIATWERAIDVAPDRSYLALAHLERAYAQANTPSRFVELCRRLTDGSPREWRARVALARHLEAQRRPHEALELLLDALEHNPHALAIHQALWNTLSGLDLPRQLVARYIEVTRRSVFYLDPHVCTRCRYRSTELLWQCPHCHEWNTFVEERIAPATDQEAEIPVVTP